MATSGQTLNDRLNAAKYALAGQGLARCVYKATTEEIIGPKRKHLDYLIACTHEPNVSIPQMANLLIERTNHIYWVVVFKALVTVHHLMSYGNERFSQYLASSNYSFDLSTFSDKTATRNFTMSTYIRRYSRYINEKALSYRLLAFDFCKIKRGNEGVLRLMPIDRLLKTLPILQNQLDALLGFDCSPNDLNNGVINACFMLLFRDLIGLFACHNDGIINLLNAYFNLNKKMCREAFELYKKFLVRMDKVSDFLEVAKVAGVDKDDIPDLRRAPGSLIEALEQHLLNLDSSKKILKQQQSKSQLESTSASFGAITPPAGRRNNSPSSAIDELTVMNSFKDDEVRRALEEEARVMSQYGGKAADSSLVHTSSKGSRSSTSGHSSGHQDTPLKFAVRGMSTSSVSSSNQTKPKIIDDLFDDSSNPYAGFTSTQPTINPLDSTNVNNNVELPTGNTKKASDDLLSLFDSSGLNNGSSNPQPKPNDAPFAANDALLSSPFDLLPPPPVSQSRNKQPGTTSTTTTITNGKSSSMMKPGNPFPETGMDDIQPFATMTSDAFTDLLQPTGNAPNKTMQPSVKTQSLVSKPTSSGIFKGDLDSTIANVMQNLNFDGINNNSRTKK